MPPASAPASQAAAPTAPIHAIDPPSDLTPEELVIWMREAPLALAERTLIPATVGAFRELCELEALKNRMLSKIKAKLTTVEINEEGAVEKANPLLTHYRGAVQRLATFRKDFKLAPFGKPVYAADQAEAPIAATAQKRTYW